MNLRLEVRGGIMELKDNTKKDTLITIKKRTCIWMICAVIALAVIVMLVWAAIATGGKSTRSESYKKTSGSGAGLNATIVYDCAKSCGSQKYGFNVYILNDDGQQVSVVRPDQTGAIRVALAQGNYVLLIGKEFGENKSFPEEKVTLKSGQELTLNLHYKEVL
jgi:hypothetical protein